MRKKLLALSLVTSLAFSAQASNAANIDFDAPLFLFMASSYTTQGVTFTSTDPNGWISTSTSTPAPIPSYTFQAYFADGNNAAARAVIAGGADFVSIDMGDFGGIDADELYLKVYDTNNNLLATATDLLPSGVQGMRTLSVSAQNISYAIFGGIGYLGTSSVYYDNFSFRQGSNAVPEPASWAMMIGGLAIAGAAMRRRGASIRFA